MQNGALLPASKTHIHHRRTPQQQELTYARRLLLMRKNGTKQQGKPFKKTMYNALNELLPTHTGNFIMEFASPSALPLPVNK